MLFLHQEETTHKGGFLLVWVYNNRAKNRSQIYAERKFDEFESSVISNLSAGTHYSIIKPNFFRSVLFLFLCSFLYFLIVFFSYFEKALRMRTYRTDFRRFLSHYQMSAVAAFPHRDFTLLEYRFHFYVL